MARGLCAECYPAEWYATNRDRLGHRPASHRPQATCHPDRPHQAKGLCATCYMREYQRQRLGCAPRKRTPVAIIRSRKNASAKIQYYNNLDTSRERGRRFAKQYRERNPDKVIAANHKRRARLLDGSSPGVSAVEWQEILDTFGHTCAYCLRDDVKLTREHVEPISRGGRDEYANVVPACFTCNASKGAKTLLQFIAKGHMF